jgi:hypothetical protein
MSVPNNKPQYGFTFETVQTYAISQIHYKTLLPLPLSQDPEAELTDNQEEDVMQLAKLALQHST